MQEYQIKDRFSKRTLIESMRERLEIKLRFLWILISIISFLIFAKEIWLTIHERMYLEAAIFLFFVFTQSALYACIIMIFPAKVWASWKFREMKKQYGDKVLSKRTFTIRDSYLYAKWDVENAEEEELGQILRIEVTSERLFLLAGFLESKSSKPEQDMKLKKHLYVVRKDAFVQGTAEECYQELKEHYPLMQFTRWRD